MTQVLDPQDPGLFSAQFGMSPVSDLMLGDPGSGGRYTIGAGNSATFQGAQRLHDGSARALLDPGSGAFALFALGLFVLLVHAHGEFRVSAGARAG